MEKYSLDCGHDVDQHVAILFHVLGKGTEVMCEVCNDWKHIVKPKAKRKRKVHDIIDVMELF